MNIARTLTAAALSLILAACGGGSDPAPVTATCVPKVVTIGLYGDSTNYGETDDPAGGPQYRAAAYPEAVIQRAMDARFGVGAVVVSTHAINNTRLDQLLAGGGDPKWGSYPAAWPAIAQETIALENYGINDAKAGVTPEAFAAELATMAAAREVVFETPLPFYGSDGLAQTVRDQAKALGVPLIDVNAYVHSLPDWSQYLNGGIHPSSDGYAMLETNAVVPALVALVAPIRCEATP